MPVSIISLLQSADYNLQHYFPHAFEQAREQLHTAVTLIDRGYNLDEDIDLDDLISRYNIIDNIPMK